jgi:hypothetical protein
MARAGALPISPLYWIALGTFVIGVQGFKLPALLSDLAAQWPRRGAKHPRKPSCLISCSHPALAGAKDEVWGNYRFAVLADGQEADGLKVIDLGAGHSSSGKTLCGRTGRPRQRLTGCTVAPIPADYSPPVRYPLVRPWLVGSECSSIT